MEEPAVFQSARLDNAMIVLVNGSFDGSIAPAVHREIDEAVASGVNEIIVDVVQATIVDEGAVAVLSAAAVAVLGSGGRLYLALSADHLLPISDVAAIRAVFS
jgi:anti-anti-sigma regulatory factor